MDTKQKLIDGIDNFPMLDIEPDEINEDAQGLYEHIMGLLFELKEELESK